MQNAHLKYIAKSITEKAKLESGIEIHPAAKIGDYFVIDHGVGTVIGETCEIGEHCYILQGVILGSTGIAYNPLEKRHPTLGNNVEIGAHARILGPITIGDNVKVSPYSVIREDIPSNTSVIIQNQCQKISNIHENVKVFGVVPFSGDVLKIYGKGLADISFTLDNKSEPELINYIELTIINKCDASVLIKFKVLKGIETYVTNKNLKSFILYLWKNNNMLMILSHLLAIEELLSEKMNCFGERQLLNV